MTIEEKLDNFYTAVIDSATAQSIEIMEEYESALAKTYEERRMKALKRANNTYRLEVDHIIREKNRMLSQSSLEIKRRIMERTTELTDLIYQEVRQRLQDYMNTPDYVNYLKTKIIQSLDFARTDEMIIYINPSDEGLIPVLEEETKVKVTISNRDFFGGIRAVIPARSVLIDHSFTTKLEDSINHFQLM